MIVAVAICLLLVGPLAWFVARSATMVGLRRTNRLGFWMTALAIGLGPWIILTLAALADVAAGACPLRGNPPCPLWPEFRDSVVLALVLNSPLIVFGAAVSLSIFAWSGRRRT